MRINWTALAIVATGVAISPSATADQGCAINYDTMVCDTAGSLVTAYPVWLNANSLAMRGARTDPSVFYRAGCWFVGTGTPAAIKEDRKFSLKDGFVTLSRVAFRSPLVHSEDRYSAEGEYLGKAKVVKTEAWTLRRDLSCH